MTKGEFYREYWAEHEPQISNQPVGGKRWRVNDSLMSTDQKFGDRWETHANGLLLTHIPEVPANLARVELQLELWGGHPHTGQKSFAINGKRTYQIPSSGAIEGHCTYTYPTIALEKHHLVNGTNAFQFSCDRGSSFWGHYIIDQASVRCYYAANDPNLEVYQNENFRPQIHADPEGTGYLLAITGIDGYLKEIISIDYRGHYFDFDDTGNQKELAWHGFTQARRWHNHVGTVTEKPFTMFWDTEMLPDQHQPITLQAIIHFKDGYNYIVEDEFEIVSLNRPYSVQLITCDDLPIPFWSRDNQLKETTFRIDHPIGELECVQLLIKIWDGGEGNVEQPFTINGHAYVITSGQAIHDVVFTEAEVDLQHLKQGTNTIRLLSDTDHHGIEVLYPGPCFRIKTAK